MFDSVRKAANKTKMFVQDHPTVTACVITAVVTARITKTRVSRAQIEEIKGFMYTLGYEAGETDAYAYLLQRFVHDKGLQDEVDQFTREMFNKAA